jgi:hypothetical protein
MMARKKAIQEEIQALQQQLYKEQEQKRQQSGQ